MATLTQVNVRRHGPCLNRLAVPAHYRGCALVILMRSSVMLRRRVGI